MNVLSDPGTLVILDGIDGGGKSTLAEKLAMEVSSSFLFRFPTKHTEPGKLIRRVFADPKLVREEAMLYLFVADALDGQAGIRAALDQGQIVLCDRYTPITAFAYNVSELHNEQAVAEIIQLDQFIRPDIGFIVDVGIHVAEARIAARSGKTGEAKNEIYEKNLADKRARYRGMARRSPFLELVDGEQPIEKNVEHMAKKVIAIHKKKGPPVA